MHGTARDDVPAGLQVLSRPTGGRATAALTVFLVDPHEVVQIGLRCLLAPEPDLELVGVGRTTAEAHRAVVEGWADVVLVDADLDGDGGRSLAQQLAAVPNRARWCVLVGGTDPTALAEMSRLGASGLLSKRAPGRHLVDALRRLGTEDLVMDPGVAELVMASLLAPQPPAGPDALTERDLELLRLLGEGRTNREIAEAVYLSEKTVKNYLSRLFRKLGVRSRTEAALLSARYHGAGAR